MFARSLVYRDDFAHRVNNNATVDSICLHCFATVASLGMEADLRTEETAHRCWQRTEHMNQIEAGSNAGVSSRFPHRILQDGGSEPLLDSHAAVAAVTLVAIDRVRTRKPVVDYK